VDHLEPVPSGAPTQGAPEGERLAGLLQRSARGDQGAFAELYDATSARCHGLALRVVRNPALAEEVLQDAYLDVWRHSARFDVTRGSAIGWMLTVVHRKAVDRVRSVEAATTRETTYQRENSTIDHDQTAEAAHGSLEAQRVRGAVTTLTTVQREAVELAYFGGYTHTEVATMLDVPVGTAKTRIRDGLIRLRDAMGVE
jgi:RNA polymerase sigma-70 factor, ECF subfamily